MRVIPVLDLRGGRAVRAGRAPRDAYPLVASLLDAPPGDAVALARAFRDRLGCDEWYVADLDAIAGRAPQEALLRALAAEGGRLLVDGGVGAPERARALVAVGAARVVVGLETLPSFDALCAITRAVGCERVVFSLDLRAGEPMLPAGAAYGGMPLELAARAAGAGAQAILVLDLARVGTGTGVDLALVERLRRAQPGVELLAGGGIAGREDLERLADAGCDAVLVATALHDGGLGPAELALVRGRHARDSR